MLKKIQNLLYIIRDTFWQYPEFLFIGKKSLLYTGKIFYKRTRPFSHLFFSIITVSILASFILSNVGAIIRIDEKTLIEGVLVGVDDRGNLNNLQKVNPLVLTNIQLEKDLNELIYESLIEVNPDGSIENVLIENIVPNQEGDNYRVKLREDVYWHDSTEDQPHKFTARDVKATFDLLSELDANSTTKTIYSTAANKRIRFIPVEGDDYRFEFQIDGVIPNFYELISFKILPAKYLGDINSRNILTNNPQINKFPVGTGKFEFDSAGSESITLERNENYYIKEEISQIKYLRFDFFLDEESIIDALLSGKIHAAASISTDNISRVRISESTDVEITDTIYNQYYSLYFNLAEDGPDVLKNTNIRRAISAGISRSKMIGFLEEQAEEAYGPIGVNSFAYEEDIDRYTYDTDRANSILDTADWVYGDDGYRYKDGERLEFDLTAVNNVDRNKISESIVRDLEEIGIKVNLDIKTNEDVINQNILNRDFDSLLYSMTTFIDPDRFELFHSSQIAHPGLNLSSYTSEEETIIVVDGEDQRVPEVDVRLENGRAIIDEGERIDEYSDFQKIISDEVPAVFLYHPKLNYAFNKRVQGVNLERVDSIEERYRHINEWEISSL